MQGIVIKQADITQVTVEAIVNAANQRLLGGAGVDGAIHKAGGPSIMAQCDQIRADQGGCPTGQAVMTTAGNLPAKKVIHTVGPIYSGGSERESQLLSQCYLNSMKLAEKHALKSLSFPNISTGVYGYPKHEAAKLALTTVSTYLARPKCAIKQVVFVCFDDENYSIYLQLIDEGVACIKVD